MCCELRYWAAPAFAGSATANRLENLLRDVFPRGLRPLTDKIERLEQRAKRYADNAGALDGIGFG